MRSTVEQVLAIKDLRLEELTWRNQPVGHFAVTDGNSVFGVVKAKYQPVSYQQAVSQVREFLPEGEITNVYTTNNLSRAVFNIKLPKVYEVGGDSIQTYVNLRNSLDGGWTLGLIVSPVRVVCQNTFVLHLKEAFIDISEKHTVKGVKNFFNDVPLVEQVYRTLEGQVELANKLKTLPCTTEKGRDFLNRLAEKNLLPDRVAKKASALYENPTRTADEGRDFWSLLNATTDVLSRNLEEKGRLSTLDSIYRAGEAFSELVEA